MDNDLVICPPGGFVENHDAPNRAIDIVSFDA
jgi:hypothetical protein